MTHDPPETSRLDTDYINRNQYLIDDKVCPYCIEKTRVVSRWFGLPTIRKCPICKRAWETGW